MEWNTIMDKIEENIPLSREEAIRLLQIDSHSAEFYRLLALANTLSRQEYGSKGYVFAQIGLNAEPCGGNCAFCSMASSHFTLTQKSRLTIDQAVQLAEAICGTGISDLFLMTTMEYPFEEYIAIGQQIRKQIPPFIRLVANIGDFSVQQADRLKQAGFTGAYHIHRLQEGIDTGLSPQSRLQTIQAIREAGLELYYCIEPIGPEHPPELLADEMIRARDYAVEKMAVMRRTPVPGTPLAQKGSITQLELTKIAAVTRLVTRPHVSMNVHEPTEMALLAGVNQLYAEFGSNPRDIVAETEQSRGYSVKRVTEMLRNADYQL